MTRAELPWPLPRASCTRPQGFLLACLLGLLWHLRARRLLAGTLRDPSLLFVKAVKLLLPRARCTHTPSLLLAFLFGRLWLPLVRRLLAVSRRDPRRLFVLELKRLLLRAAVLALRRRGRALHPLVVPEAEPQPPTTEARSDPKSNRRCYRTPMLWKR